MPKVRSIFLDQWGETSHLKKKKKVLTVSSRGFKSLQLSIKGGGKTFMTRTSCRRRMKLSYNKISVLDLLLRFAWFVW